jgi:hypothetical protein
VLRPSSGPRTPIPGNRDELTSLTLFQAPLQLDFIDKGKSGGFYDEENAGGKEAQFCIEVSDVYP